MPLVACALEAHTEVNENGEPIVATFKYECFIGSGVEAYHEIDSHEPAVKTFK